MVPVSENRQHGRLRKPVSIADISDTARVVAFSRAVESERSKPLFRDPFARQLAGDFGEILAREMGNTELITRGLAVRTAVVDELLLARINQDEIGLVLNLGAGLDTRPWRLALPRSLKWIDADLPQILSYKTNRLRSQEPACEYLPISADITSHADRAALFSHIHAEQRALVLTEGLLVYLSSVEVTALALDLQTHSSIAWWLTDVSGPRALAMMNRLWGPLLENAEFKFGPADSETFFREVGWRESTYRSSADEARRLNRSAPLTWLSRILLKFSSPALREEFRRLAGVTLLARDPDFRLPSDK